MVPEPTQLTALLRRAADGDEEAGAAIFPLVYDELRAVAANRMRGEPAGHTLQPTALVHEAFLRLVGGVEKPPRFHDRSYFFAAASEAMRRILVERARRVGRLKRGGDQVRVTLDDAPGFSDSRADEVLAVDQALQRLETRDARMAKVAKLRFFVGLTVPEVAEVLAVSPRSVERLWTATRAFLARELRVGA